MSYTRKEGRGDGRGATAVGRVVSVVQTYRNRTRARIASTREGKSVEGLTLPLVVPQTQEKLLDHKILDEAIHGVKGA